MRAKTVICAIVTFAIILLTSLMTVVINNKLSTNHVVNNIYNECNCAADTVQSSDVDSSPVSSEVTTQSTTTSRPQESKPTTTTSATVTTRPKTATTTTSKTTTSIAPEQSETPTEPAPQEMREVNINTASADEISECLLIDIELADEIVSLREQIGYYSSVDELFYIDGLGEDTIRRIAGYVEL